MSPKALAKRSWNLLRAAVHHVAPTPDHLEVDGSVIATPDRRWCGPEFKDDRYYLASAEAEARRLVEHFGCTRDSRVLDIGCGQGRLPIGLLRVVGALDYLGIDVDEGSVDWCRRHIRQAHPSFRFQHLDLHNERYNPGGVRLDERFRFDAADASRDIVYLYSVFSHTTEQDACAYLRDFRRVLADGGGVFFTTFVETGVPDFEVNPSGYRLRCSGPLHVVRYERDYLFGIVDELGYELADFSHATEADGQSALYLRKR
jgi:SAM-dependent methyltransferase